MNTIILIAVILHFSYAITCSQNEVKIGIPGVLYDGRVGELWAGACGYPLQWCSTIHDVPTMATFTVVSVKTNASIMTIGTYDLRQSLSTFSFCFNNIDTLLNATYAYIRATIGNESYTSLPGKSLLQYSIPTIHTPVFGATLVKGQWTKIEFGISLNAPVNAMPFTMTLRNDNQFYFATIVPPTGNGPYLGRYYYWKPSISIPNGNGYYLTPSLTYGPVNTMSSFFAPVFSLYCPFNCPVDTSPAPNPTSTTFIPNTVPLPIVQQPSSDGLRIEVF